MRNHMKHANKLRDNLIFQSQHVFYAVCRTPIAQHDLSTVRGKTTRRPNDGWATKSIWAEPSNTSNFSWVKKRLVRRDDCDNFNFE